MPLSQWAEAEFKLPERGSATPGPFRCWPPQREIMDTMGDPNYEWVTVMKSARVGYTKGLMAAMGNMAANSPCAAILLVPTEDDARGMAVDELDPCFQDTPVLAGLIQTGRLDGRNTLTMRSYPGGSIKILAAKAPRNLRRHDAKVLFVDEVDGMVTTSEGDPVRLAVRRTMAHADRKIIIGSTPTTKGASRIEKFYSQSDMRIFEVLCPECSDYAEICWDHIKWDHGKPETAQWCCPHCGCLIPESAKFDMVTAGRWRATKPQVVGHAGFHWTALTSFFVKASWAELAAEYEAASETGPEDMQVFVNTILGLPYEAAELAKTTPELLHARREDYGPDRVPSQVLLVTGSVDVQPDRFEVQVWGWGMDDEAWVLDHLVVHADPSDPRDWDKLGDALGHEYMHPCGRGLRIESVTIDSGFMTQRVYDYCREAQASFRPYFATKGMPGQGKPVWRESDLKIKGGGKLYLVGVDDAKTTWYRRLAKTAGPGMVHFPNQLELTYFKQVVSEIIKTHYKAGLPVREWILPPGKRNEALDTAVGNLAARARLQVDYGARLAGMQPVNKVDVGKAAAEIAHMLR